MPNQTSPIRFLLVLNLQPLSRLLCQSIILILFQLLVHALIPFELFACFLQVMQLRLLLVDLVPIDLIVCDDFKIFWALHEGVLFSEPLQPINLILKSLGLTLVVVKLGLHPDYLVLHQAAVDPMLSDGLSQVIVVIFERVQLPLEILVLCWLTLDSIHKQSEGVTAWVNLRARLHGP